MRYRTLDKNWQFNRVYGRGKSYVHPHCVLYVAKNRLGYTRIGLTATKKVGHAVQRNRARRIMRAALSEHLSQNIGGYDIILVARARTPYLKSTRTREGSYTHEFTDKQHVELLRLLLDCRGKVVLCGYDNALYNNALSGWCKVSYGARAGMGKKRVECLWMNYPDQLSLFKFHA